MRRVTAAACNGFPGHGTLQQIGNDTTQEVEGEKG